MSGQQILTVVLATAPTMITVLVAMLVNNARLGDFRAHVDARFNEIDRRFADVDRRFAEMERKMDLRFADAKETWRSELHRVEEVLDARLKHLEPR